MPEIFITGLTKSFGHTAVLSDLSLTVHDKEFLTLLGPSGCGKSTTLMSIAGLLRPDRGCITCGDHTFYDGPAGIHRAPEQRNLGIVFQSYAVWPHMTVFDNVAFPLRVRKLRKAEVGRRVGEALELVELAAQSGRYPHELSGGQQQRVALARALVYSPAVLLLDEPFSNLDAKLRERTRAWLRALQRSLGLTTIFVTHDQHEALAMSDRVLVMDNGVAQQTGTPEDIYRRPSNRFVADFVGQCNFLTGTIVGAAGGGSLTVTLRGVPQPLTITTERQSAPGERVTLALRPERIHLVEPTARTPVVAADATVADESFLGDCYHYRLVIGDTEVLARSSSRVVDTTVQVWIDPRHLTIVE